MYKNWRKRKISLICRDFVVRMKFHEKTKRKQDQLVPGTVSCLTSCEELLFFSPAFGVKVCKVLSAKKPNPGLPWWLRSKEPTNEGDMSSISGPGRSHVADQLSPSHTYSACALTPGSCNQWACLSWYPCSATREATPWEACALQQEGPCSPHLEKSLRCREDPAQPSINK